MTYEVENKLNSTIVARINAVQMPESDRQRALHALQDAELLVDAFVWAAKKIERLGGRLFLKPALKH